MAKLATRQHGNVTSQQLLDRSHSRMQIARKVAEGWLIPRHSGVFAVGHVPRTRESTWAAAVLAVGSSSVLSHRAAAALWGILRGPVPIEVTVPTYAGISHRDGIRVHRAALPEGHFEVRDRIRVTSLLRTVLDIAAVQTQRGLERSFEQAQVLHHLDPVLLAAEVECRRGYRGNGKLRRMLIDAVDPTAVRSVLELRFLRLCQSHGIPRPLVNEQVGEWRPDFLWPEYWLVVETDSAAFHESLAARRRDPLKDEALAALGFTVMRLRWRDVVETPAATAAQVLAALATR